MFTTKAAVLDNIQKGTTTLAAGSASVTQTITAVTTANSFLVYSIRLDANAPEDFQVSGHISATNQLIFARTAAGGAPVVVIEWQVFEFSSGVFVQRGEVTALPNGGSNVTLGTAIDLSESFVLLNMRKSGGTYGSDDGVTGDLTTTTNLYIDRRPGGGNPENVYWQVIEWDGASVQKITATLPAGTDSIAIPIPIHVIKEKSMVVGEHQIGGNVNSDDLPATELFSDSSIIFTRTGTARDMDFICYVVEFSDNTDVIHGAVRFLITEDDVSTTVSSVSTANSGIINGSNYNRAGSGCFSGDDNVGYNWATFEFTNATTLRARRSVTGFASRMPFQILEFTAAVPAGGNVEPGFSTPRMASSGLCVVTLPVEITAFNAILIENKVKVSWTTATEINNDYFTVQKSNDGLNFEDVKEINGAGNSNSNVNYQVVDNNPYAGVNYYRLKQTDFDRDFDYSKIVSINNKSEFNLSIYPNPSNKYINVIVPDNKGELLKMLIYNSLGQVVFSKEYIISDENNRLKISTTQYEQGLYHIKVLTNRGYEFHQNQLMRD